MSFPAPFDRYHGEVSPEWIDANGHLNLAYYIVLFPAVFLSVTVLAVNLVGDGLRDAADPYH